MAIIYCYTNLINNKKYIGQTINPTQRKNAHKSGANNERDQSYNTPFHRAIRKYGWDNFSYEVLVEIKDDNFDLLNQLEIFYINFYNTIRPNGYNILEGGKNASNPMSEDTKEQLRWSHGKLSREEVIQLRLAYANKESPTKIYNELYKDRLHYNSFLNIWIGKRYSTVMPEVLELGRHTKLTEEEVKAIKLEYLEKKTPYAQLGAKYGVTRGAIESIINGKTWKHVQIEPVSTIPESGE